MCEDSGDDFRVRRRLRTANFSFHSHQVRFFAARLFRSLFGDSRFITNAFFNYASFTCLQSRLLGAQTESHIIRIPLCQPTLRIFHIFLLADAAQEINIMLDTPAGVEGGAREVYFFSIEAIAFTPLQMSTQPLICKC
jgi:hypothetical protein